MIVKRIGEMSLGRITGLIYASIGLFIGVCFATFAFLGSALGEFFTGTPFGPLLGPFVGVGALIAFPLLYGVLGFVGGLLVALLYNLVAQRMGGLQLDVE